MTMNTYLFSKGFTTLQPQIWGEPKLVARGLYMVEARSKCAAQEILSLRISQPIDELSVSMIDFQSIVSWATSRLTSRQLQSSITDDLVRRELAAVLGMKNSDEVAQKYIDAVHADYLRRSVAEKTAQTAT